MRAEARQESILCGGALGGGALRGEEPLLQDIGRDLPLFAGAHPEDIDTGQKMM